MLAIALSTSNSPLTSTHPRRLPTAVPSGEIASHSFIGLHFAGPHLSIFESLEAAQAFDEIGALLPSQQRLSRRKKAL